MLKEIPRPVPGEAKGGGVMIIETIRIRHSTRKFLP
jgi:hypothetical protein